MRWLYFSLLIAALSVFSSEMRAQSNTLDLAKAQGLFTDKLYPFMRTNCAECHSERATEHHGPNHSSDDSSIAFKKFQMFMNWENPGASRIMKMVTSRHFCTDYHYKCQQSEEIVQKYSALLAEYVTAVKQSSLIGTPPRGSMALSAGENADSIKNTNVTKSIISPIVTSQTGNTIEFDVSQLRSSADDGDQSHLKNLRLVARFEPFSNDYHRLMSLDLVGESGIFQIQGIHFLINGLPINARTGFEQIARTFIFEDQLGRPLKDTLRVAAAHPILKFSAKDKIQIEIVGFKELDEFPTRLCSDENLAVSNASREVLLSNLKSAVILRRGRSIDDTSLCYLAESEIDMSNPRRSVLLESYSDQYNLLNNIEQWVASYRPEEPRGKKLFHAAGCINCHTNREENGPLLGGGLALKTTFGTFYTPNISKDPINGIGKWTNKDFIRAMREGLRPDGSYYYPVFPYRSYSKMSDRDLIAIKNYLFSLPPVPTKNRDHEVSLLYRARALLGSWQMLYFQQPKGNPEEDQKVAKGPFVADPVRTEQYNRGAYLVEAVAHCAECHTPRDRMGGLILSQWMSGSTENPNSKAAPNITPDVATGTGRWTPDEWMQFLASGRTPRGRQVTGEMAEVIESLNLLSKKDQAAMVAYLISLPAKTGIRPEK